MTREEALRVFQQEHSQLLEQCQQRFIDDFPNKVQTLMELIMHLHPFVNKLRSRKKKRLSFFIFRCLGVICLSENLQFYYKFKISDGFLTLCRWKPYFPLIFFMKI